MASSTLPAYPVAVDVAQAIREWLLKQIGDAKRKPLIDQAGVNYSSAMEFLNATHAGIGLDTLGRIIEALGLRGEDLIADHPENRIERECVVAFRRLNPGQQRAVQVVIEQFLKGAVVDTGEGSADEGAVEQQSGQADSQAR